MVRGVLSSCVILVKNAFLASSTLCMASLALVFQAVDHQADYQYRDGGHRDHYQKRRHCLAGLTVPLVLDDGEGFVIGNLLVLVLQLFRIELL